MKYLIFILLLGFVSQAEAQRHNNPKNYFRQFQNENRKLRIKNLRYLKASLRGDDERKVSKYREMVLDQAKESKREIERVGSYEDYDILQKEYVKSMQMYIDAFQNNFGVADELSKNMHNSYEDMKKYYDAVTKAEGEMLDASYRIEQAEEHFAKTHYLTIERDQELDEQYRLLDEITLYSRDMTLSFFRVEAEVKNFLGAIERNHKDSLPLIVNNMQKAIQVSQKEVEEYADFEGEKDLYNELQNYLEEMQDEINENLRKLADDLQNEFMEEKEYQDVQKDLKGFVKRHNYRVESFFETKRDLIAEYLPEE